MFGHFLLPPVALPHVVDHCTRLEWTGTGIHAKYSPPCTGPFSIWSNAMHDPSSFHPSASRRNFLARSATVAAGLGTGIVPSLFAAHALASNRSTLSGAVATSASPIRLVANEHPDGPSTRALAALSSHAQRAGGRYPRALHAELVTLLAKQHDIAVDHIALDAGSSPLLDYAALAFTSPQKSLVSPDPSYEAVWLRAAQNGAKVHRVPLRSDFTYDANTILQASKDAGLIYLCNPNNPTGTVTPHEQLLQVLANKPEGSVVLVDEAYIEFADTAVSAVPLVTAGEDVIVLRTFSKIYGLAGVRLGYVIARPELLAKIAHYGTHPVSVTALAAGIASIDDDALVASRKQTNSLIRDELKSWFENHGYRTTPSQSNCFLVDIGRPPQPLIQALRARNVLVGRSWEALPTWFRINTGTALEIEHFKQAFLAVETELKQQPIAYQSPLWSESERLRYSELA
jgi:histidinol-phosphate aminotransferase